MEDVGLANSSEGVLCTPTVEKESLQGSGPTQNISQSGPSLNSTLHISPVKCISSELPPASTVGVDTAAYSNSSTPPCQKQLPTSGVTDYSNTEVFGYNQSSQHYYDDGYNYGNHNQYPNNPYKDTPQETYPNTGQYSQHPDEYYNDTQHRSYPYDADVSQNPTAGYNVDQHKPTNDKHMDGSIPTMASGHHVSHVTPAQPYTDPPPNAPQRKDWDDYTGQQQSDYRMGEGSYNEYPRSCYPETQPYSQSKGGYDYEQSQYYEKRNCPDTNYYKWNDGHYSETASSPSSYNRYAGYSPNSQTRHDLYTNDASSSSHHSRYYRPPRARTSHTSGPRHHRGSGLYQGDSYSSQCSDHSTPYTDHSQPSSHSFNSDRQHAQQYSPRSRDKVVGKEYYESREDTRRKKTEDSGMLDRREDSESSKHCTTKSSVSSGSFMQKRAAILKQAEDHKQGKPSKGPPIIQPHHVSDPDSTKDKKSDKATNAEALFPKRSLENFKIPKRKSATASPIKKTTSIPALGLTNQNEPKQEPIKATLSSPLLDESRIVKAEKKKTKSPNRISTTSKEKVLSVNVPSTTSIVLPTVLSSINSSTLRAIAAAIQKTLDEVSITQMFNPVTLLINCIQ